MASPAAVVTIGGIGASLSNNSIYAVASFHCKVRTDSSALEKLSQSKKSSPMVPISTQSDSTKPIFLTSEESRSAILVLLNKLLFAEAAISPTLPLLMEETLNLRSGHETVDFGSSIRFLDSICVLNGKKVDEIGVTVDEISVMESSYAASIGILAILDCCSSALIKVSDAVAALSCEAVRADVAAFDLSGDSWNKDEIEVVRDMKVYLFGSKLIRKVEPKVFNENPTVHGRFRKAVRTLHSQTREELVKKTMGVRNLEEKEVLLDSVLPLARSIRSMGRISTERSRLSISYIADQDLRSKVIESFEKSCPSFDVLRGLYDRFYSTAENAVTGLDFIEALHYAYESFVKLREIIAWEAALALFALEMDDSIEKTQVGPKTSI